VATAKAAGQGSVKDEESVSEGEDEDEEEEEEEEEEEGDTVYRETTVDCGVAQVVTVTKEVEVGVRVPVMHVGGADSVMEHLEGDHELLACVLGEEGEEEREEEGEEEVYSTRL
jgi:hypothetical protein